MYFAHPSLTVEAELFSLDREMARRGLGLGDDSYWVYQLASSRGYNTLATWLYGNGKLPQIRALLGKVRLAGVPLPDLRRAARRAGIAGASKLCKYELMTCLALTLPPEELAALGQSRVRGRRGVPSPSSYEKEHRMNTPPNHQDRTDPAQLPVMDAVAAVEALDVSPEQKIALLGQLVRGLMRERDEVEMQRRSLASIPVALVPLMAWLTALSEGRTDVPQPSQHDLGIFVITARNKVPKQAPRVDAA